MTNEIKKPLYRLTLVLKSVFKSSSSSEAESAIISTPSCRVMSICSRKKNSTNSTACLLACLRYKALNATESRRCGLQIKKGENRDSA
jgi:hypothetical protein